MAVAPHSRLENTDVRTRKNNNIISAWKGLAKDIAEAKTLHLFKDNRLLFQLLNFVQKSILCAKLTTCEKKNCCRYNILLYNTSQKIIGFISNILQRY